MSSKDIQFPSKNDGFLVLQPDDPIEESARRIIQFQYKKMRFFEHGVTLHQDGKSLHKMRVAVRRIRIAHRVMRKQISKIAFRPYIKDLRGLGDKLGVVRDLDVFLLNSGKYKRNMNLEDQGVFELLEAQFDHIRRLGRSEVLAYLESPLYKSLCEGIESIVNKPNSLRINSLETNSSNHTQSIAREIIRQRFQKVLSYHPLKGQETIEELHKLRIKVKAFRYTIEYFKTILEDESDIVIEKLIAVQNHLGGLNDAAVAISQLDKIRNDKFFLDKKDEMVFHQITRYRDYLEQEAKIMKMGFPEIWEGIQSPEFQSAYQSMISL